MKVKVSKVAWLKARQIMIPPAHWETADQSSICPKCRKRCGKSHNCRACGKVYCGDCTSKVQLPAYFERKNKTGPMRVCDECRFRVVGGVTFSESNPGKKAFSDLVSSAMDHPAELQALELQPCVNLLLLGACCR